MIEQIEKFIANSETLLDSIVDVVACRMMALNLLLDIGDEHESLTNSQIEQYTGKLENIVIESKQQYELLTTHSHDISI